MGERRAPGMEHGGEPDASSEMLGVGGDGEQRLGRGLEEDGVDLSLVLVGDVGDRRRQREHHVIVGHGQELGLAVGQPCLRRRALALGAMAVAARVIGDVDVVALLAARDMAAVRQRSIADITLSWPRLRWPAWARRQAGPWARKISATSSLPRGTPPPNQAGGRGPWLRCSSGLLTARSVVLATSL